MATTYIHVNQHVLKKNLKHGTAEPMITIKNGKTNVYCHEVEINGPSRVVSSSSDKPLLSCGARVVIATESPVTPIVRAS